MNRYHGITTVFSPNGQPVQSLVLSGVVGSDPSDNACCKLEMEPGPDDTVLTIVQMMSLRAFIGRMQHLTVLLDVLFLNTADATSRKTVAVAELAMELHQLLLQTHDYVIPIDAGTWQAAVKILRDIDEQLRTSANEWPPGTPTLLDPYLDWVMNHPLKNLQFKPWHSPRG